MTLPQPNGSDTIGEAGLCHYTARANQGGFLIAEARNSQVVSNYLSRAVWEALCCTGESQLLFDILWLTRT